MNRQLSDRSWSKPLAAASTRPIAWLFMDLRVLIVACACGVAAMWAPDWWQLAFAVLAAVVFFAGVLAWRHNPYLIDEVQAHCALPHGGPDDAYEH